jgi:hypothetical protein
MCSAVDFSDAAGVRDLAAAGERLVCLEFPDGLGSLYAHSFAISSNSPVLRSVLEDTQQQGDICTIPLAGDSDISVWKLALGLIYHVKTATITLANAHGLLLLADKWDMDCITGKLSSLPPCPIQSGQGGHTCDCSLHLTVLNQVEPLIQPGVWHALSKTQVVQPNSNGFLRALSCMHCRHLPAQQPRGLFYN